LLVEVQIAKLIATSASYAAKRLPTNEGWQAELWADIHEFAHSRHFVRLFEPVRSELKEIAKSRHAA
jgi:hypothetical protein